ACRWDETSLPAQSARLLDFPDASSTNAAMAVVAIMLAGYIALDIFHANARGSGRPDAHPPASDSDSSITRVTDALFMGRVMPTFSAAGLLLVGIMRLASQVGEGVGPVWLLLLAVVFGVLALAVSWHSDAINGPGAIAIFSGIAAGTLTDVVLDATSDGPDRNLWPLEILVFWVSVAIPVLLGVNVGRFAERAASRRRR
ncbi:MAG TPA: hypothetical protein VMF13_04410, partial [Luteitalea sp.]|nr:hypothetical protein [Luteitalea sp.]